MPLVWFDETSTHMQQTLGKVWTKMDKRIHLPRTSRGSALTILGGLTNFTTDRFFYTIAETTNTEAVLDFLEQFEESLTEEQIEMEKVIVIDSH